MVMAVGLPDLHPGNGRPVGAVFVTEGRFYPFLIGNDVGCGMGLWKTYLKLKKMKLDWWMKKLDGLERPFDGDVTQWLADEGLEPTDSDYSLGTIGGGNHFAELQMIESVEDQERLGSLGLDKSLLVLMVHSGSRRHGDVLIRSDPAYVSMEGLSEDSNEAVEYLREHDRLLKWARANRSLIAHRFLSSLGSDGERVVDLAHNSLSGVTIAGKDCWLHRKGAAPSDNGPLIIPGSRGSLSYLVAPVGDQEANAYSIAHGAGRKWNRSDSKGRLRSKYNAESLLKTDLGSRVICEDKELLYQEAPQAYKNIDVVIRDMIDAGLISIIASLRPVITYKMRKSR